MLRLPTGGQCFTSVALTPAHAVAHINKRIEKHKASITKWATQNLAENPASAFSWSREQFDIAARIDVLGEIAWAINSWNLFENELTIRTIQQLCATRALREARSAASLSSSPTSNVMDLYKLQASFADTWSDMREALEDSLRDNPEYVAQRQAEADEKKAERDKANAEVAAHNVAVKAARAKARRLERKGESVPADVLALATQSFRAFV